VRGLGADRRFLAVLIGLGVVAFGVRVGYAEAVYTTRQLGDDWWYHWMANAIAAGHGFNNPFVTLVNGHAVRTLMGSPIPTAYHPPLFPVVLAGASKVGLSTYGAHRVIGCALGGVTAVVVGLCGRRLGGRGLGIASAATAALFPPLVANDSHLLSESLYGALIACVILLALRLRAVPTVRAAAALGAAIGLAALTRSEAILLVIVLVPFVARTSWRLAATATAVTALLVVPWCIRNTDEFHRPVTIATGDGSVLAGANTHATYYGGLIGGWDVGGLNGPAPPEARINEAVGSDAGRQRALDYAGAHVGRLPVVFAARVLRTWNLYPFSPAAQVRENTFFAGGKQWAQWLSLVTSWFAFCFAIAGTVVLQRRGQPLSPLLAPVALVTIVSLLFNGDTRYRDAADISLVLLAPIGATSVCRAVARARARRVGTGVVGRLVRQVD
jgi:4-amino-4-deoxy-L-arabinose transferase-like glycosyltransferase